MRQKLCNNSDNKHLPSTDMLKHSALQTPRFIINSSSVLQMGTVGAFSVPGGGFTDLSLSCLNERLWSLCTYWKGMKKKTNPAPWEAQSCILLLISGSALSKMSWANKRTVSVQSTGIISIYSRYDARLRSNWSSSNIEGTKSLPCPGTLRGKVALLSSSLE